MTLPKEVKKQLEEVIDDWLSRFEEIAETEVDFLVRIGLEPNLETLLSYTAGVLDSLVGGYIHCLNDRGMTEEENDELVELLKRIIPELERECKAFLSDR
jgi:hypothetical protein